MQFFKEFSHYKLFKTAIVMQWKTEISTNKSLFWKFIIITFLASSGFVSHAQQATEKTIDSLLMVSMKIVNVDESNNLNEQIKNDARKIGYTLGIVNAEINIASNLYNQGKYDVALSRILEVEPLVISTNRYSKITNLFALKANCFGRLKFFDKSAKSLNEAMFYAEKIEETDRRLFNVGKIYRLIGVNITSQKATRGYLDSALYYHKKSYTTQQRIADHVMKNGLVIQANVLGDIFLAKGISDSAKYYYTKAVSFAEEFKVTKFLAESKLGLGAILLKENDIKGALENYQIALAVSTKTKSLANIKKSYHGLALVHERLGDESKSLDYSKKHGQMADSLSHSTITAVSSSADLIVKENEKVFARKSLRYFWLITAVVAVAILLTFSIITLQKQKNKLLQVKEKEQKLLNEKIQHLQSDQLNEQELAEIIRLGKNNDPAFFASFKKNHPLFIQKLMLKAPGLLGSDLILCAQLRLGFYTKDIARYTDTTVRAVEGKKYRLRKKLNLHTDDDIYRWILNL